jgi:hypothetical protein
MSEPEEVPSLATRLILSFVGGPFSSALFFDRRALPFGFHQSAFEKTRTLCGLAAKFFPFLPGAFLSVARLFLDQCQEALASELAVGGLGAGVLDRDGKIGRNVAQRHSGGDFVDILPARTRRPAELLFQIRFFKLFGFHAMNT